MIKVFRAGVLVLALVSACAAVVGAEATEAVPNEAAPGASEAEVAAPASVPPQVVYDTEIFRRTPVVDGVIAEGEWDTFYSISGSGWDTTVYVDWDGSNLYIASKSAKPVDILAVVDAKADGWFHGEDNYEFRSSGASGESMTLAISRYDSRNSKTPSAMPVSAEEAAMVDVKSSRSESSHMLEMRIPGALISGLRLVGNGKVGLGINVKPGDAAVGWLPSGEPGDTVECTLVTRKFASLKPLELGFDLRDERVARGDDLVGRFHITNAGADSLDIHTFVIAGEGKAGEHLSSQRVRMEGLPAKRHVAHDFQSIIPSDMGLGCWAVGAEVRSRNERLGSALVSFEVVEPFGVELRIPEGNVRADVKNVTFSAVIKSNTKDRMNGVATITLPPGWELWRNADQREFVINNPGGISTVGFKAKPPLGAEGKVPVKMDITVGARTMAVEGSINVVAP